MSKRLLIQRRENALEIALMEENKLLFFSREKSGATQAEQIYLGVVDRIVKGMEAAFVRLANNQVGFLPFSECREKPKSGDKMLVQVKRPPVGEKAAYLTADISLAGRYALLTPLTPRFSVSKRIESPEEKERLLSLARVLAPKGMGLVMRQESAGALEKEMAKEIEALSLKWQSILSASSLAAAPCLLKDREDALTRLLRDERGSIEEVLTNCQEDLPALSMQVIPVSDPFGLHNVQAKLEKSLQRKVWLDCGGFLIIDPTEAMTVIDVNSGKFTGMKSGTEQTFLKLNLEAAREIARLLRLRNIGGIIIIDFVDMAEESSREQVTLAFKEALQKDPVKSVIHGFTSLGLMEMTRKKADLSPSPLLLCPRCHGTGRIEDML